MWRYTHNQNSPRLSYLNNEAAASDLACPRFAGHGRQADSTLLLELAAELAWFQAPSRLNLLAVLRAPKLLDSLRRCLCRYAGIPAPLFFNPQLCITLPSHSLSCLFESCPLSSLPKDGFPNPLHSLLPRLVCNQEYGSTCL